MSKLGIFFGSDTGNTENIAILIKNQLNINKKIITTLYDISKCKKDDFEIYNKIFLGIPTWYYGEAQCDWDDFFPTLKKINFKNKTVAIFGCGDQEDYSEYFCDAMGLIKDIIISNKAKIVGYWSIEGYSFESSKALVDKNKFVGLAIDEDRQPELTNNRIKKWIEQVSLEMNI